ncbi:conjugal transfer protein TrbL [Streptococcus sp. k-378]|uniref:conjugal transfer protein TrbL n=1 Tax=Streptococcus sp. k-378 TaxID=2582632 RepID=UPI00156253E7|nr:conjugal transfer protein TrbL [Streptococcus sp. k-378]
MNLDIRELTSSLSSYSSATNQAVNMMADAVRPIGYILLGLFFWFEMESWSQMVKSREGALTQKIWLEALMKYLFALIMISASSQICDAILELLNIVVKVIAHVAPTVKTTIDSNISGGKSWFEKHIIEFVGFIVGKVSNVILGIIVFLRYLDLYMLKALAPLLVAFFMMDSLRSVTINFLKYFAASALIGVILIIVSVVYDSIVAADILKVTTADNGTWGTAFASIAKGVIYIFVMVGSSRKAKQLIGV